MKRPAKKSAVKLPAPAVKAQSDSTEKPIEWRGSSLEDLTDDKLFPIDARRLAGFQLHEVQHGLEPAQSKPFPDVGPGARELIVDVADGWYRVMYVAKFAEAVYVLHCFKKKTNKTTKRDKDIAEDRYKALVAERKERNLK